MELRAALWDEPAVNDDPPEGTSHMPRTLAAAIVAVGVCVLVLLASVAQARDDGDRQEAGVSLDGATYQESLEGPLFSDEVSWGPGDLKVSRFWVRGTDRSGDLTISLDAGTIDSLLDSGRLKVVARAGDQSWRAVRPGKALVLTESPAADGVPVSVRVALSSAAPKDARVNGSDIALTVKVGDTRVVGAAPVETGPAEAGPGEAATWWVVPLGLLLLSGGALLYGRREITGELR